MERLVYFEGVEPFARFEVLEEKQTLREFGESLHRDIKNLPEVMEAERRQREAGETGETIPKAFIVTLFREGGVYTISSEESESVTNFSITKISQKDGIIHEAESVGFILGKGAHMSATYTSYQRTREGHTETHAFSEALHNTTATKDAQTIIACRRARDFMHEIQHTPAATVHMAA